MDLAGAHTCGATVKNYERSAHKRAENRIASCDVTQTEISRQILRLGIEGRSEEEVNVSCPICLHPLLHQMKAEKM
eukprot:scaffold13631_cov38-Cyclotella_meneghiniana.AAC.21